MQHPQAVIVSQSLLLGEQESEPHPRTQMSDRPTHSSPYICMVNYHGWSDTSTCNVSNCGNNDLHKNSARAQLHISAGYMSDCDNNGLHNNGSCQARSEQIPVTRVFPIRLSSVGPTPFFDVDPKTLLTPPLHMHLSLA